MMLVGDFKESKLLALLPLSKTQKLHSETIIGYLMNKYELHINMIYYSHCF
jgi:hypothetical protein